MQSMRDYAKTELPDPYVGRNRRRTAVRIYMKELGYEIHSAQASLDPEDVEARLEARREGAYGVILKDLLERTDLLIQEMDRRIGGFTVRFDRELRGLKSQMEEIRVLLDEIAPGDSRALPSSSGKGKATTPPGSNEPAEAPAAIPRPGE
jgi:hypothetical protein